MDREMRCAMKGKVDRDTGENWYLRRIDLPDRYAPPQDLLKETYHPQRIHPLPKKIPPEPYFLNLTIIHVMKPLETLSRRDS